MKERLIKSKITLRNRIHRLTWFFVNLFFFRFTPNFLHSWRCLILRLMGAKIGKGVAVYPNVKIWSPKKLLIEDGGCLGDHSICYNVAHVHIGREAIVSQYSYLCTAGHDIRSQEFDLQIAPIKICEKAWVGTSAFVGPGVIMKERSVAAANSSVIKDVESNLVVGGNPAKVISKR